MFRRFCLLALLPFAAHALDLPPLLPANGKWEVTTELTPEQQAAFQKAGPQALAQIKKSGANLDLKAGTLTGSMCVDEASFKAWQESQGLGKQCGDPRYTVSGNTLTTDIQCGEPDASTLHSVIVFNPARDAYTFENQFDSASVKRHVRGKGHRVGDC
ncbi:hypothetical protein GCM10007860_25250 [Chitiniphilus shinanonensis]|uniref:DUF3617 family protein n=1 Tax=Chitiniphilus shinanonensis TaxID=553088 RepID=A0ABQ6BZP2_9NEIS|nr:DUF3617 family protein [Chitiniphilus shinanonensis]GLS05373.1 hypothetical protein GCM10007860_25250 [Chitiniphilus shinanonensis]